MDLRPENVHTLVLWSKDFANYLADRSGLRGLVAKYEQAYFHFTITGLGGTLLEKGVPSPDEVDGPAPELVAVAGSPARVSVRFDPVVFWREGGELLTNLPFFERLAPRVAGAGIEDVRVSFAQWYGKAKRRAEKRGFEFVDPEESEKRARAREMAGTAAKWGLVPVCLRPGIPGGSPRLQAFLMHRRIGGSGSSIRAMSPYRSEGPDPAARVRMHGIQGYRQLHPGLPALLHLLLRQPDDLKRVLTMQMSSRGSKDAGIQNR